MTKVVLFDFDGTIADSLENFFEIVHELSILHNLPIIPREELEKFRSEGAREVIKKLQIPFYKLPFIAGDMRRIQGEHISKIEPIAGLPDVLHKLKKLGYVLGIVTSNGKENVETFIRKHDIDIFDYIHCDTSIFGKDKVINNLIKKYALTKDDVIYVGDEIRDIQACQKVGVKIIAVTWGFNNKEGLTKHKPDFLINKPAELLKAIQ